MHACLLSYSILLLADHTIDQPLQLCADRHPGVDYMLDKGIAVVLFCGRHALSTIDVCAVWTLAD